MNIFWREMRSHYRSFLVWSGAMIFLVMGGMMKYSAFAKTGEDINSFFKLMPKEILAIMGIKEGMDVTSVGVFYSIFFLYFILLMVVHSTTLGSSIIIKEERDKTADFLLVKPISRNRIVTFKLLAASVFVILFNIVTSVSSIAFVEPQNTSGVSLIPAIMRLSVALLIIQFLFLGVGLFLGASSRRAEKASGIGTAIILGTFILKVLIDLKEDLNVVEFLTPFRYFNSMDVMYQNTFSVFYVVFSIAIAIACSIGAYLFFRKRDIHN